MSEGFTIETPDGEIAGIVVRHKGERGFRFHASQRNYEPLDGHVFVTPAAAERAAVDLSAHINRRPVLDSLRTRRMQ